MEHSDSTPTLTAEQMRSIQDFLKSAATKTAYKPTFDFHTLLIRFSEMMSQIELASNHDEEPAPFTPVATTTFPTQSTDSYWRFDWKSFFIGTSLTVLGGVTYKGIRYALKYV